MSKGALVAGAAVGFFLFPMIFPARQTFFNSQNTSIVNAPAGYATIPNLNIDFTTVAGDSVVFSFTGNVIMEPSGGGTYDFSIYFVIDGIRITSHYLLIREVLTTTQVFRSAALSYVVTNLSPGAHNVTIQISCNADSDNYCGDNVLTVQIS